MNTPNTDTYQTGEIVNAPGSIWDGAEVVSVYTRAQALADGDLVDVTETAKKVGFKFPVALTAGLWADINNLPTKSYDSADARLWDVLYMATAANKNRIPSRKSEDGSTVWYGLELPMKGTRTRRYTVKAVCGPGDTPAPVLTFMREDED